MGERLAAILEPLEAARKGQHGQQVKPARRGLDKPSGCFMMCDSVKL